MSEPAYTCAVWYIDDHGQIDYELAQNESEAARLAAWADGDGTALGLQRADGSTLPAATWQEFADEKRRQREAERERWENPPPPVPIRRALDPFRGRELDIEVTEPDWLGERRG
jgi:hypothetical protein